MTRISISLSMAAKIVAAIMIFGCGLNELTAYFSLSKLRVGGPIYERVILGKDLIADILPPPEYLLESYLEATLAFRAPGQLAEHRARLAQLRKDYEQRHDYWSRQDLDPNIRELLLKGVDAPARAFWVLVSDSLLPAVERGDDAQAASAYERVTAAFKEHRAKIEQLVAQTGRLTDETEAYAATQNYWMSILMALLGASAFGVTAAAVFGVLRFLVRPVTGITEVMSRMAAGDLLDHVPNLERSDEIGDMSRAVEVFLRNEHERRRLAQSERASRDMELRRQQKLQEQMQQFSSAIAQSVVELGEQTGSMRQASSTLNKGAASVKSDAQSAAAASIEAAQNSQAVAAATVELEASIREIAAQAARAREIVESTAVSAERTDADMVKLAQSSQQIDAILELIRSIAGRTNLLALNATIEAARAGEAGRGFAVVASEVKGLSEQTGKAVDEIAEQIGRMHGATSAAVDAIRDINGQIAAIRELTQAIADSVEQQDGATREIAHNVTQAAGRSEEAANSVQAVTVIAVKTDEEAVQLADVSEKLAGTASSITAALERFIAAMQDDLKERRKALRQSVRVEVMVERHGRSQQTLLDDVSLTGAQIVDNFGFRVGDAITIDLEGAVTPSRIIWVANEKAGVEFTTPLAVLPPGLVVKAA